MRKVLSKLLELIVLTLLILEAKRNEKVRQRRKAQMEKAKANPSQAFKDKFNTGNDSGLWTSGVPTNPEPKQSTNTAADSATTSQSGNE